MAIRPARETAEPRSRYDGMRMPEQAYLRLPEEKPYLEYIDGRVVQKAMPKKPHFRLQAAMSRLLLNYEDHSGGSTGTEARIWFDIPGNPAHLLPDVSYWAPGKPPGDDDRSLPPTLAVEIRSPRETLAAVRRKCAFYRANGVDAAWLVDPDARTVEVFEDGREGVTFAGDDVLESAALTGFSLALADLFAVLDR